ncbi:MAG: LPS-assembly protein LptD [Pseudomonadota bacterium]
MRCRLNPVATSLLFMFVSAAHAEDSLQLQIDPSFMNPVGKEEAMPIFISAERLEGEKGRQIEASGKVELRTHGQAISADRLIYQQDSRDLVAEGRVRIEQDGNVLSGPRLQLNLETNMGDISKPEFYFRDNNARGSAATIHIQNRQNYVLRDVSYTTCPADNDDWLLKVRELEIDRDRQIGAARGAHVEFMGVPILYTPWMDFSLNEQRKSGFLGPVFGSTGTGGSEVTLPYYWNIAPNRDATVSPRFMLKRGVLINTELRYLEPEFSGEGHVDVLPGDHIANFTRSRLSLMHTQNLSHGLGASLNLNRVSDDAYFRDLSTTVLATSQTNLVREGVLSYTDGWWNSAVRLQNFQTLQDPAAPVTVPYHRVPQITLNAQHTLSKANMTFAGEFADFRHPTSVSGQRLVAYPSVSYPLVAAPAFYLTPKLGLHTTYYAMGANNVTALPDTTRVVPIFSLDSGMTLERDSVISGRNYVQTLEPRAYYVYIPYRDQNQLPNFDTAQADFSFAQMFTENRFFGNDRVGDANQITLALTSRLLLQDSGAEQLRVAVGQRFNAETPKVSLTTQPVSNKSDIIFAVSGQLTPKWSLDSAFQYNPNQSESERIDVASRFQPEAGKVLNLGYRFTRGSLRQADLSTQWPLTGRWHTVARWNYSLQDHRVLEALAGFEYNESCWTVRLVAQNFTTATQQFSTGFFVQLELNELVKVGPDPLSLLQQSIPGYTQLNSLPHEKPGQTLP